MKNIKINHAFTLRDILESIEKIIDDAPTWEDAGRQARRKLNFYLDMIDGD